MQALGSVHQREATLRQFSELGNAFALLTMMDQVGNEHAHRSGINAAQWLQLRWHAQGALLFAMYIWQLRAADHAKVACGAQWPFAQTI